MKEEFIFIKIEKTSSTQDAAKELAKELKEEFCVSAKIQTAGYGRRKTKWFSPPGGLYLTLCLKRNLKNEDIPSLALKSAAAVKEFLKKIGVNCEIKPPNDLLAKIKGEKKKICGILCETSPSKDFRRIFIGVGLNLNNKAPKKCSAVSVSEILKNKVDEDKAGKEIVELLRKYI